MARMKLDQNTGARVINTRACVGPPHHTRPSIMIRAQHCFEKISSFLSFFLQFLKLENRFSQDLVQRLETNKYKAQQ